MSAEAAESLPQEANDNEDEKTAKRQKMESNNKDSGRNPPKKSGKAKNGRHPRPRHTGNGNNNNSNDNTTSTTNTTNTNTNSSSSSPHKLGTDKPGKDIHPGSYANAAQRALFNVHLAEYDDDNDNEKDDEKKEEHRVKRKVVMLLAYVGTNYGGFQINEGQQTLQGELELAMFKNRFLSKANFGYPFKYGWSTSGRTDKGVHACAQVVSCKMEMTLEQEQDLTLVRCALNETLPDDVRVVDVRRVSRAFCAHTQRDRVRYQYMIPSFCLQNAKLVHEIFETNLTNHLLPRPSSSSSDDDSPQQQQAQQEQQQKSPDDEQQQSGCPRRDYSSPLSPQEVTVLQDLLQVRSYRVTPDKLNRLKQALQLYQGTHSFHNLAKGVKAKEARATRYIISFHVEDPIVLQDGMEWIPTQVLGQSFLLHQIRKMVCLALDVARHDEATVPLVSTISRALSPQTTDMRMGVAPAQGLYLDMSFYNGYNQRKNQRQARGEPHLPDLDWGGNDSNNNNSTAAAATNVVKDKKNEKKSDLLATETATSAAADADAVARWKEFRNGTVMKHVVSQELQEGNFIKHLYIQEFAFDAAKHYQLEQHNEQQAQEQALKKE